VVLEEGDQVVLSEDQLPVQVGDGEVGQGAQALDHKLLGLLLADLGRQVTDVVLPGEETAGCQRGVLRMQPLIPGWLYVCWFDMSLFCISMNPL